MRVLSTLSVVAVLESGWALQLGPPQKEVARREVMSGAWKAAVGLTAVVSTVAEPAKAYQGVYGMEVVSAKDAVLDEEALASKEVKGAIADFRKMYGSVKELKSKVLADDQFDVVPALRKDFDPVFVRSTFNSLTPAFDKDTQKGTDRLTRGIIQDLLEVETSAKLTPGKPRSEKKIATVNEKLVKLEQGFGRLDEYLASA